MGISPVPTGAAVPPGSRPLLPVLPGVQAGAGPEPEPHYPGQYASGQPSTDTGVMTWPTMAGPIHDPPHPPGSLSPAPGEFHLLAADQPGNTPQLRPATETRRTWYTASS
jgi:hypothetical protein